LTDHSQFLGTWRQVRPDPLPAQIAVTFAAGGVLTYTLTMNEPQTFAMRWRVEGETLISINERGEERVSQFRFASPTMLVLEHGSDRHVYRREE
jgi:hypothetical protein